jgi:hypothetical protein
MIVFLFSCGKKQEQGSNTSGNTTNSGSINNETKTDVNKTETKSKTSPAIGSYSGAFTASVYDDKKDYYTRTG